ncbi:MAG: glycosyltransferase family protein [Deltaproteobacteria bacterium]|nr:glycosyltransferase family protein [Deltaproteobacteria bacterium]
MTSEHKSLHTDIMIQARMGSTRLPGKIMFPLGGNTILGTMIDRVKRADRVRHVVVLTTELPADDAIVGLAERHDVEAFRGSETDLLDRYYRAALHYGTDVIVRLTADCPFMDPELIDDMVNLFQFNWPNIEFLTNCNRRTFARGLDIEIFSKSLLKRLYEECCEPYYREHVVPFVEEYPEKFAFFEYPNRSDDSTYRLTIDKEEDYETITAIYAHMKDDTFTYSELMDIIRQNEHLLRNAGVIHKPYKG